MAAMHHGAAAARHHRRFSPENTSILKPVFIASSSSPSFPTKNSRRKNHLRQKILKTLKNPIIPKLPISPTTDSPPEQIKELDITHEIQEHENSDLVQVQAQGEEAQELKEVEIEVPAGAGIDGRIGLSGKNSILKYGLWLVGAFVFQTVCAVLFFGLDETEYKKGTDNGSGELTAKDDVLGVLRIGNGNDDVGKLEMESKIEEIRLMAREVREKERLQSKRNGEDGEETDEEKYSRSEIEEEVDGAMGRLRKKLEKRRLTKPLVKHSSEESRRGDGVEKGDLLYEKKYKFKEFRFLGSDDRRVNGDMEDSNEVSRSRNDDDGKKGMLEMKATEERVMSKEGKRGGVAKAKVIDGTGNALEKNNVGSEQLGESSDLDTAVVSDNLSKGNGTFRGKGFGNAKPVTKSKKESLWWSNLPYVLVIFMQRGSGSKGLYTLKSSRNAGDRLPPYAVAFEDSGDANNFCYLLESFFEDLEDFEAHVAPLTVKEVKELAESFSLRVVVVKRGQLQMYAGQPLTDAEMALGSIIDQD